MRGRSNQYPVLLDGGLANQLESQGCNLNHPLWTSHLLQNDPEAVIRAHLAYLRAGAQCIATASYQANFPALKKLGYDESASEELIRSSVNLAVEARKRYKDESRDEKPIWIAGSIGPYGAYLADGSEYRGKYDISDQGLVEFHQAKIEILSRSPVDLLAFETFPSLQEIRVICSLTAVNEKESWLSVSCKDGSHISDGTPIEQIAQLLSDHPTIFGMGINCTEPRFISDLIIKVKPHLKSKRLIVYPNSGDTYDPKSKTWSANQKENEFLSQVPAWLELGVDIIGGCCRIGPEEISMVNGILNKRL